MCQAMCVGGRTQVDSAVTGQKDPEADMIKRARDYVFQYWLDQIGTLSAQDFMVPRCWELGDKTEHTDILAEALAPPAETLNNQNLRPGSTWVSGTTKTALGHCISSGTVGPSG